MHCEPSVFAKRKAGHSLQMWFVPADGPWLLVQPTKFARRMAAYNASSLPSWLNIKGLGQKILDLRCRI